MSIVLLRRILIQSPVGVGWMGAGGGGMVGTMEMLSQLQDLELNNWAAKRLSKTYNWAACIPVISFLKNENETLVHSAEVDSPTLRQEELQKFLYSYDLCSSLGNQVSVY
ncbi:hypothetical protein L1987_15343 [Smallanthus sonchifolius]|uniref:Uncharacterized protein n=1 Tax=Smallanthus sonchifolius TaxID=185202 RepID=A0ACB9J7C6_9ASTR|nr:hypothetical protein L1987_15343 [Smallanthus sonchifolius]